MRIWLTWSLGLLCAATIVVGLVYFVESYEDEVWIGASEEARRNPYMAAKRFLEARGSEVHEETTDLRFDEISTSDIVFLSEVDSILVSQSQIDAAVNWIEQGGFLIVGVGQETEGYDSLLARFQIQPEEDEASMENSLYSDEGLEDLSPSERLREINRRIKEGQAQQSEESDSGASPEASDATESEPDRDKPVSDENDSFNMQLFNFLNVDYQHTYYPVELTEDYGDVHLAVLDRITLAHPLIEGAEYFEDEDEDTSIENSPASVDGYQMVASIADDSGTRLLQFDYGDGTLTAISSAKLWNNDYIGVADHALFLAYFVPENSRLHLFYNFDVPSIVEILRKLFLELLIISLVMLLLWLWRRGIRVQREVVVVEGQRRNFQEHLHAAAKFMTANKQFEPLISSLQHDIADQMRSYYPGFAQLAKPAQVAMLVERTQLSQDLVQSWADYCDNLENQEQLLAALKIGNAIRKKL